MKTYHIILMLLIIILAVFLYLACDRSPVDSGDDPPDPELISLNRGDWTKSSRPVGLDPADPRGKLIWYNPYTMITTSEIWDRELESGESATNTFWMEYSPSDTGNVSGSWAGITQNVSVALTGEDTEQYLELRIYGSSGIIHIDMGHISEDINGNGRTDTEDKIDAYSGMPNGIIDDGEDCGRDGLFDHEEPGYDYITNPDPNGDNWYYNGYGKIGDNDDGGAYDYSHINGTEGNHDDPVSLGRPDSEDLDREGDSDILNSYVSYKIDLSNSGFRVVGSNYNGWKTYRIPLDDSLIADTIINSDEVIFPIGSRLECIRIWLGSQNDEPFVVGIASADLLGFKEPGEMGFIKKEFTMRDYQYAYGRIFDLGRLPINCDDCSNSEYDFYQGDSILSLQVFENARIGPNLDYSAPVANFYVDVDDTSKYTIEKSFTHVHQIDPSEYIIHPTEHWIMFNSAYGGSNWDPLGYYMIVMRANSNIDTIGNISSEPYSLKLIRNHSPLSSFVSWNYEWRNVYSLGHKFIDLDNLEINIYEGYNNIEHYHYNIDHQEGVKYIKILGLDRFDRNGAQTPDGLVDVYNPSVYARSFGLLVFPQRKPFASNYEFVNGVVLYPQIPEIYDLQYGHTNVINNTKYYIKVTYLIYDYVK